MGCSNTEKVKVIIKVFCHARTHCVFFIFFFFFLSRMGMGVVYGYSVKVKLIILKNVGWLNMYEEAVISG